MQKSTIPVKLKKRGRPATGVDPFVGIRIPAELLSRIDAWASKREVSRSEAIRELVEKGMGKRQ